ncbi:MAG: methylated-DNA--[protein]-cysteine S-methyltransferase [Chlorobium sp.]
MVKLSLQEMPIGTVAIAESGGWITNLYFQQDTLPHDAERCETALIREAFRQLHGYLQGELHEFTLPFAPAGTPFMQRVWDMLFNIPYGATASYKEVAIAIGNPRAVRAVGMANQRNPLPLFIPCHRVVGSDGSLTGYRGGVALKQALLELERSTLAHLPQ